MGALHSLGSRGRRPGVGWEAVETLRVGARSRSPEGGPVPARLATRVWQGLNSMFSPLVLGSSPPTPMLRVSPVLTEEK